MTLEAELLDELDPHEGVESFDLQFCVRGSLKQVRAALQRLRRKGLADPARCPDGAWVWYRTTP